MLKSKSKKLILLAMTVMMLGGAMSAHAATYENYKGYTNKILPNGSSNTTLEDNTKTTSRSYGKAKVSTYTRCSGISCWFRSNVD